MGKEKADSTMKPWIQAIPLFIVAILAAVVLLCVASLSRDADAVPDGMVNTNETTKVDFDFTQMNSTMLATYTYRLAANPSEFAGKTLRISGQFLTRVDEDDGKRYFGCLMGNLGGCACCAPGGVLEFVPKDSFAWPANFPPVESRIMVTGRVKMFAVGSSDESYTIPRLVDADMTWDPR